jgi:hypothetical protein
MSCVAKLFERMVKARFRFWAKSNKVLTGNQAGFRRNRSTEDQVLRITQTAQDGLRHKDRKRSILTLIDFSRAFDKVWKIGLLWKLSKTGIPSCLIK